MTDYEKDLIKMQGEMYEHLFIKGYDVRLFSDMFLASDTCNKEYDDIYCPKTSYGYRMNLQFIEEVIPEAFVKGGNIKNGDLVNWIGEFYRRLQIETRKPSKVVLEYVSFDYLSSLWAGFHTIDQFDAIERFLDGEQGQLLLADSRQFVSKVNWN